MSREWGFCTCWRGRRSRKRLIHANEKSIRVSFSRIEGGLACAITDRHDQVITDFDESPDIGRIVFGVDGFDVSNLIDQIFFFCPLQVNPGCLVGPLILDRSDLCHQADTKDLGAGTVWLLGGARGQAWDEQRQAKIEDKRSAK